MRSSLLIFVFFWIDVIFLQQLFYKAEYKENQNPNQDKMF